MTVLPLVGVVPRGTAVPTAVPLRRADANTRARRSGCAVNCWESSRALAAAA